ncbi:MAG TPA: hypothetical protein VMW65_06990 [Chloroflexota bacterium]|nr:hypothetical protein [Chloroflexota bacterium]
MITIEATVPLMMPPTWAILERQFFDVLDQSVDSFLEKYVRSDGSLIWRNAFPGRDGADDFYETCYNWPLLYALGGGDHLLSASDRLWNGITQQLTALGHLDKEYERGYDWFHQGEGNLYFYFLCLADPSRLDRRERAVRFAGFYLNEDPATPNFDPERQLIRAPHNGSNGPRWGFFDSEPSYGWSPGMARYGLPFADVPGVASYDDLKDPALAKRMGQAMQERLGQGDVVGNLAATSLVTNAFLLTGAEKYRRWVLDYVDAWAERARRNGGLLPDNVGLSGKVGEYLNGKWYGGLYGWTWPHGFYNVAMAAVIAAENALLLTGDRSYLDLPRAQIDQILGLGTLRDIDELTMSLHEHWIGQVAALGNRRAAFVVPYRFGDEGWFDYQPMAPIYPAAVWHRSLDPADWARLERLRAESRYDWNQVLFFRTKEDGGHEAPWLQFLAGQNPGYPEEILRESYGQVAWRLSQIRSDRSDLATVGIHHWQQLNPILTEALIQLTLGAPPPIYNGGLLFAPIRYFDDQRHRPGLPRDVAALVTKLDAERVVLELTNLSPSASRDVVIQAGTFGEHRFTEVRYSALADPDAYPGPIGRYSTTEPTSVGKVIAVRDSRLRVRLAPNTRIELVLGTERFVNQPGLSKRL